MIRVKSYFISTLTVTVSIFMYIALEDGPLNPSIVSDT